MKIGKKTKLTNGTIHDIEYGDIFSFDFKSLKGTSFDDSNLGQSINKENPDDVIIKIDQNQFGKLKGILELIKDNKVIISEEFYDPMFMNYIIQKDSLEFIKNEKIENKVENKMKIGKKTKLTNGTIHDIEYGDIFSFDFKSLKGTSFEGSNLGRSINEENPDEVIIKIDKNQFGYFKGILEFIKDGKTIVSEEFYNPMFMNYVTGKDSLEFIKNEKIEHKVESKVKIEDVYLIPFSEFEKMKYLKEEKLEELKLNKPTNVVVHFFNMKEINEEMYPDCLTAKVYAFNKNGFVNFDTPEDIAEDKQYCLEEKKEYNPEMHIVDYSFNGLSNSTFNFMEEKGMFKNKIGKYKGEKLDFETLKGLLPQIKKLKNYSIKR